MILYSPIAAIAVKMCRAIRRGFVTLKMAYHQKKIVNSLLILFLLVGIFLSLSVSAADENNVGGFAWSENIGWISFNDDVVDGAPAPDPGDTTNKEYGVGINIATGEMSGYAWSENIGWISFNAADVEGCNGCSGSECVPIVDSEADGSGNHLITGWARATAAVEAGSNAGGWDGCLKFKDSYIDSNGDFHGWMTSSADATTGVVGWVNLNSKNCNGSNCTEDASYKVHTSAGFGPVAAMECGGSCPGGYCDTDSDSTWIMYAPTGDCPTCNYKITNTSEGDIQCTSWELVGTSYGGTYDGKQNLTFSPGVPTGTYTLKLTVSSTPKASNNSDCSLGLHSSVEHEIRIKEEAGADFMCSLDDPGEIADPLWLDCESEAFEKKVMKGERLFLSDDASLAMHSVESDDGTQIDEGSRYWTLNVDGNVIDGNGSGISFTAGKSNILKLEVGDDASRTNCKIINFGGKTLPKWEEVNPVSMLLGNLRASLAKLFDLVK